MEQAKAAQEAAEAAQAAAEAAQAAAEAAQQAAFAHAGVDGSQAVVSEVDFDYEDGRMVYEIEFYAGGAEYEYDVDASTGAVVKFSREGGHSGQGSV